MPSNGWRPGPGKVGQGCLKVLHLWRHSQKIRTPQPKKFFCLQATRLATSFELLTESVALTGLEKFQRKAMWVSVFFSRKSQILARRQVLNTFTAWPCSWKFSAEGWMSYSCLVCIRQMRCHNLSWHAGRATCFWKMLLNAADEKCFVRTFSSSWLYR